MHNHIAMRIGSLLHSTLNSQSGLRSEIKKGVVIPVRIIPHAVQLRLEVHRWDQFVYHFLDLETTDYFTI